MYQFLVGVLDWRVTLTKKRESNHVAVTDNPEGTEGTECYGPNMVVQSRAQGPLWLGVFWVVPIQLLGWSSQATQA